MNLIRNLALFEAVGVAVEGIDALAAFVAYRDRIH